MRRKLIYSLIVAFVLACVYSFTLIKPVDKKHPVKTKTKNTCNATITINSKTYTSTTVTINFTSTGTNNTFGGYYSCNTTSSFSTSSSGTSVVIPLGPGGCGGTGRAIPLCYDGTEGTSVLFTF